jgi:hypothetical protein
VDIVGYIIRVKWILESVQLDAEGADAVVLFAVVRRFPQRCPCNEEIEETEAGYYCYLQFSLPSRFSHTT